ncbi:AAA family ATPase [Burkholderia sp. KJ006]|uniref:AAA family ATPase n=1 Tax=Burkholderia sp. KJ006 TaxID=416344 RepID=UPI00130D981C|nr:AAA family ATPase [Burkholderia sp. KJ006]
MKLTLEGIGTIQKASVELNGLTVIAGENDTGKSTVGKVFFAIAQAFTNFSIAVRKQQANRIRSDMERIYMALRREFDLAERPDIRNLFSVVRSHALDPSSLPIADITALLRSLNAEKENPERTKILEILLQRVAELQLSLNENVDQKSQIGKLIHRALNSEFAGELLNKPNCQRAYISLSDGATSILEMWATDTKLENFKGTEPLGIRDATLIDGPAILQYCSAIRGYDPTGETYLFSGGSIPYHAVDLSNKLQTAKARQSLKGIPVDDFGAIFKGEMYYDEERKSFVLSRGGIKVPANNVASGIKALSIVDMLNKSDYLRPETLLILDEPETNLHPTWQIEYAKIICNLAASGVKVLVTTHSPYMLEALKGYGDKATGIKFYHARKQENGVVNYIDTDGDITGIIKTLSLPLLNLLDDLNKNDF